MNHKFRTTFKQWSNRIGEIESSVLLFLALIVGGIWLFGVIADELVAEGPRPFDEQILLIFREQDDLNDPIGPKWVEEALRDFTALGGTGILLFITVGVVGYFLLRHNYRLAGLILLAVLGSFLLTYLLKAGYDRPRPELVPQITFVSAASFPSGHSSIAAATYLTLGALIARLQDQRRFKLYVMACAVVLVLLIGISRIYLGVHWPTDVLAGWILGAVWAMAVLLLAHWWKQRHRHENSEQK